MFIAWFCWTLIWGLAGYFTVRAILMHIERKRAEKAWAAYMQHQRLMMKRTAATVGKTFSLNPFDDLLHKEDLA